MKKETTIMTSEITNTCTCVQYDADGEPTNEPVSYCYGDCWEYSVDDFAEVTRDFRESNETDWWKVTGLRLWDGEVSGYFHADKVDDLLRGMAVRGEWTMRYSVFADRVEYSLSHHDAPTGSSTVLTAVSEEQREELGLY
jgi:hypothetical protein